MSKVAFIADIHVTNPRAFGGTYTAGINERGQQVIDALEEAVELAEDEECERLVLLGDVFDTTRPSPQLIAAVQDTFAGRDIEIDLLMGNHDMVSNAEGDHALGPLGYEAAVIDRPKIRRASDDSWELWYVPFEPGHAKDWLPKTLSEMESGYSEPGVASFQGLRILALHLGIEDGDTPHYLQGGHDSIHSQQLIRLQHKHGIQLVVAGNWHEAKDWDEGLVQIGALAPTGWNNPGWEGYGQVVIVDPSGHEGKAMYTRSTVRGPRFIVHKGTAKAGLGDLVAKAEAHNGPVYLQWTVPNKDILTARDLAADLDAFEAVRVIPDAAEAAETAKKSALAAKAAGNLTESLAKYVAKMELPAALDREAVHARCKKYLGL